MHCRSFLLFWDPHQVSDPPNGTATHDDDTITYTPDADYAGTDTFGYTVSDGTNTAQGTVTVTVTRDNNAPVLGTIGDRAAKVGFQLSIAPTVTDADPTDTHMYSITRGTLPEAAAFSTSDGSITWTPVQADAGQTHTVTITVDDGRDGTDSETFDISVMDIPNAPPVAPSETATTAEDTPVTITPTISDPDMSDTPVISAVADPPNGTATHGDDTITYTPDADYEGTDSFGYMVSDGTDTTDGTITVTVTRANNAPVLGTIGDRDATVGAQLTITPSVTDADTTDAHTFTISRGTLPAAAAFSTSAGSITWTPVQADAGQTHTVTITVNDGRGGTDSETFDIVVTELLEAAGAHLEFENDLTDSSGAHGGTIQSGSVSYAAGPVGRAVMLDNTHVTLAGEPDLDFDTDEAFSIAFWINKDHEPSSTVSLVSKSERFWRQGTDIWFNPNAGGKASLRLSDGSAYMEIRTPGAVADGTWHHVAFTYDGSGTRAGMSVYVDGQPVTEITAGATSLSGSILNDHPVGIGASSTGLDPAGNTALDELHIRPGQMSASEVSALHAAGSLP